MEADRLPSAAFQIHHLPQRHSHTGDKWDKRRRQLDLFFHCFGGGGVYCSQPTGGLTVAKLLELCPNEDVWMKCSQSTGASQSTQCDRWILPWRPNCTLKCFNQTLTDIMDFWGWSVCFCHVLILHYRIVPCFTEYFLKIIPFWEH